MPRKKRHRADNRRLLSALSRQRSTFRRRCPTIPISSPASGVAQVTGGCDGGEIPRCTARGTRRAEFNLEQPYVLWCSVHGQCSRHRTNARQRSALSTGTTLASLEPLQFTIVSSLVQVSVALTAIEYVTRFYENWTNESADILIRAIEDERNAISISDAAVEPGDSDV